jgi:CBS-domain-containing membrane protein
MISIGIVPNRATPKARRTTLVRDAMTQPAVTVRPQQDLADAEQLMHDHQIRRLPVVEQDGRLVGLVTLGTIAKRDGDERTVGEVFKGISQPQRPEPERVAPTRTRKPAP